MLTSGTLNVSIYDIFAFSTGLLYTHSNFKSHNISGHFKTFLGIYPVPLLIAVILVLKITAHFIRSQTSSPTHLSNLELLTFYS